MQSDSQVDRLETLFSARRESASAAVAAAASDVTANGALLELTSPPPSSSSVGEEAFSISDAALRQGLFDEFD